MNKTYFNHIICVDLPSSFYLFSSFPCFIHLYDLQARKIGLIFIIYLFIVYCLLFILLVLLPLEVGPPVLLYLELFSVEQEGRPTLYFPAALGLLGAILV